MENVEITLVHGQRSVKPRRLVAVGKLGPGIAKILVVAEFATQPETIDTVGVEAKSA